ncbi:MAG TPA: GspH/FimT family protein [Vicinamibacterales bacterium]|nr:GspH/FimT family protein [Vicinamibacterales bacterium]
MTRELRTDRGFSLVELVAVVAVAAVFAAIAIPQLQDMASALRLGQATRELERELHSARLKAVATNRRVRVRVNCPGAGFFRMVEYLGSVADNAGTRCTNTAYPYPANDTDPLTLPNHDGPVRVLYNGVTVTTLNFEFRPDGRAWTVDSAGAVTPVPPGGTALTVTYKTRTKRITVNALGKIAIE